MVQNGKAFALKGNCIVSIKSIKYLLHPERKREREKEIETFKQPPLNYEKEVHLKRCFCDQSNLVYFKRK